MRTIVSLIIGSDPLVVYQLLDHIDPKYELSITLTSMFLEKAMKAPITYH